jgi:hypothetical protein
MFVCLPGRPTNSRQSIPSFRFSKSAAAQPSNENVQERKDMARLFPPPGKNFEAQNKLKFAVMPENQEGLEASSLRFVYSQTNLMCCPGIRSHGRWTLAKTVAVATKGGVALDQEPAFVISRLDFGISRVQS